MRRPGFTLLLALFTTVPLAMPAEAGPFYLTGRLIDSSVDADFGDAAGRIDAGDNGWGAGLGLKLGRYLAVQTEYHDFGQVSGFGFGDPCADIRTLCLTGGPALEVDSTALSLSVLPQLPLSRRFSLYGKVGVISWDSDVTEVGPDFRQRVGSFQADELLLGAGLRFELPGPADLYAEYEEIESTFETLSLGVTLGY